VDERAQPPIQIAAQPAMLVRGIRLIDGRSTQPRPDVDVLVVGDRVADVMDGRPDAREAVAARLAVDPASILVIEGAGRTMTPGLIDCHAHYLLDPRSPVMFEAEERASDARLVLAAAGRAREALGAGVTTARGAGSPRGLDVALAAAIAAGEVPGPRLVPAGRAITITGGHGHRFGVEADGAQALRVAVRAEVREGAQVVKAVASEAAMLTSAVAGVAELTEDELRAIVDEAARLRRRVLAHAQGSDSVTAAAKAGVASVEHAFLADEAALEAVAASGATLVPTLVVTDVWRTRPDLDAARRARQRTLEGLHRRSCETAVRLGIPLATGTDTGVTGVLPGMVAREVRLLHEHGLGAMAAIVAATAGAARLLGVDDVSGTVERGARADLLVIDGDPLADLERLGRPTMVIQGGRVVVDRTIASGVGDVAILPAMSQIKDH